MENFQVSYQKARNTAFSLFFHLPSLIFRVKKAHMFLFGLYKGVPITLANTAAKRAYLALH